MGQEVNLFMEAQLMVSINISYITTQPTPHLDGPANNEPEKSPVPVSTVAADEVPDVPDYSFLLKRSRTATLSGKRGVKRQIIVLSIVNGMRQFWSKKPSGLGLVSFSHSIGERRKQELFMFKRHS
ncbi:hypothetical protein OS493_040277 [Desmophyllum pertusum]|uniref:Uncharacterized protein n=1 Tax=Desmophyllum pertusum TaxID=174260 RepID=A0A9X0CD95_9CNID|nr:hypothetical protein OS493_040277 [Desmophyllum pertusum]